MSESICRANKTKRGFKYHMHYRHFTYHKGICENSYDEIECLRFYDAVCMGCKKKFEYESHMYGHHCMHYSGIDEDFVFCSDCLDKRLSTCPKCRTKECLEILYCPNSRKPSIVFCPNHREIVCREADKEDEKPFCRRVFPYFPEFMQYDSEFIKNYGKFIFSHQTLLNWNLDRITSRPTKSNLKIAYTIFKYANEIFNSEFMKIINTDLKHYDGSAIKNVRLLCKFRFASNKLYPPPEPEPEPEPERKPKLQ